MQYTCKFKPQALKDLRSIPEKEAHRILAAIRIMGNDLQGDVKHLTSFSPEYRLRVGNYRILFELEGAVITIYRIIPRQDAYRM
ncbi:MAG: hypothetical protein AMXMBFR84_30140 [Candidatus Hydrogenedentota bacterium]